MISRLSRRLIKVLKSSDLRLAGLGSLVHTAELEPEAAAASSPPLILVQRNYSYLQEQQSIIALSSAMSNRFKGWADLPDGLLESIIARLGSFHDLLAFEATCRSWSVVLSSHPSKHTLAALFPPLLLKPDIPLGSNCPRHFTKSMVPTRQCHVTDIANKDTSYKCYEIPVFWISRVNKAPSSCLEKFSFSGASCGHLIFSSQKSCVIFDVFTGSSVLSPQRPVFKDSEHFYGALTAPLASPNSHLIVYDGSRNLFWRVGSHSWVEHSSDDGPIKQIVVFKGQVFGMGSDRRIFKVHLTPQISIQELPVMESSMINKPNLSNAWLVTCGDMLLLVGFRGPSVLSRTTFEVFRLDLSTEPALWLKVEKLENWAIFISRDKRSQALSCMNPEVWGGRSNCIYCFNYYRWIAVELGKPASVDAYISIGYDKRVQPMWVVPSILSVNQR